MDQAGALAVLGAGGRCAIDSLAAMARIRIDSAPDWRRLDRVPLVV